MLNKYFFNQKQKTKSPQSLSVKKSHMSEQLWHDLRATRAVFLVDLGKDGGIQAPGPGVGYQTGLVVASVSLVCSVSRAVYDRDT